MATTPCGGALRPALAATPAGVALGWHQIVGHEFGAVATAVGATTLREGRFGANRGIIELVQGPPAYRLHDRFTTGLMSGQPKRTGRPGV